MSAKFLQIHFLTSYPAALLNRDDAGFAKRLPFGGASRIRVSSQCLKRHWRKFDGRHSLHAIDVHDAVAEMSIRSRRSFERHLLKPLVENGIDENLATEVTGAIVNAVLGESPRREQLKEGQPPAVLTNQITVLGPPELRYLLQEAQEICSEISSPKQAKAVVKKRFTREMKKNIETMRLAAGLDAALFGRMVTSDILARGDAAVHVAHAFTVHEESAEPDYFTAVDDLLEEGEEAELGAGHINTTELTSGLFYGYVVVDVPLLVSNLEGCDRALWREADRRLAAEVLRRLVHLVATVSPGAKLGSTAPYSYAHLVLVEAGEAQPRTLANAFLQPVRERHDLVRNTYEKLAEYLSEMDEMYGRLFDRHHAALGPVEALKPALAEEQRVPLSDLAGWAARQIEEAS